jgi:hypothetical protein
MSAFIALDDGRSWWAPNWAYDSVIEKIAIQLDSTEPERALASWLREQTCIVNGPGLGSVDVRELTPQNRHLFRVAAQKAFRVAVKSGAAGWHDPSFFPGWLAGFRRLLRMWKAIDREEPPGQLNDAAECMELSSNKVGPGWEP